MQQCNQRGMITARVKLSLGSCQTVPSSCTYRRGQASSLGGSRSRLAFCPRQSSSLIQSLNLLERRLILDLLKADIMNSLLSNQPSACGRIPTRNTCTPFLGLHCANAQGRSSARPVVRIAGARRFLRNADSQVHCLQEDSRHNDREDLHSPPGEVIFTSCIQLIKGCCRAFM